MKAQSTWELWAQSDPYYSVLTHERYRLRNLTDDSRREFFETGRQHVSYLYETLVSLYGSTFTTARVLDFGCGVGRLTLAFAEHAAEVVGIDVSASMLIEARKQQLERAVHNVEWRLSTDGLISDLRGYDFVHSFITMQHISVEHGRIIFQNLVLAIKPGGVGALHILYAKTRLAETFGTSFTESYAAEQADHAGTTASEYPAMPMITYSLNDLAFILQKSGVQSFTAFFTDHGGELGVILFFRKPLEQLTQC